MKAPENWSQKIIELIKGWAGSVETFLNAIIVVIRKVINAHPNTFSFCVILILIMIGGVLLALRRGFWPLVFMLGIAITFAFWFWAERRGEVGALLQALAAIVLIGVTWIYVGEVKEGRLFQEQTSTRQMRELEEARRQELRPYVYPFFLWVDYSGKFSAILKNVGPGPAKDIEYSYELVTDKDEKITRKDKCLILGAGSETADMTPFTSEHINAQRKVLVNISYKDLFGTLFTDKFEHSLRELTNNPPPSQFAEKIRQIAQESSKLEKQVKESALIESLQGIRDELKDMTETLKALKSDEKHPKE